MSAQLVILGVLALAALLLAAAIFLMFLIARLDAPVKRKLELAHEVLEVMADVVRGHEHGLSFSEELMMAAKTPAAQDLLSTLLAKERPAPPSSSSPGAGTAAVVVLLLILAVGLFGCGSTEERLRADVRMGRSILRHAKFTGRTEADRVAFLKAADEDDPPTPAAPAGGGQ